MNSIAVSLIAFVVIFVSALIGSALPGHRLPEGSKDFVRLGAGVVGTIAALVLGLLIASAKTSNDTQSNHVRRIAADAIQLDYTLVQYGPETRKARELLRGALVQLVERIWSQNRPESAGGAPFRASTVSEDAYLEILRLSPQNELQISLKAGAVQVTNDLVQTRLLLFEQAANPIPTPFLAILIIWLAIIFASFSLFVRPDFIVVITSCVFSASASFALFLILELNQPFTGLMQISNAPLLNVLNPLAP